MSCSSDKTIKKPLVAREDTALLLYFHFQVTIFFKILIQLYSTFILQKKRKHKLIINYDAQEKSIFFLIMALQGLFKAVFLYLIVFFLI
jgi:hypothetical protein